MKELAFRLHRGDDLAKSIADLCKDYNTCVILSGVGCVYEARFRLADGENIFYKKEDYEIVSLMGTVSCGNPHIHISLSDNQGNTIGGHLLEGCLINTTCELVIGVLEEYESSRPFDSDTGWDEIEFKKL